MVGLNLVYADTSALVKLVQNEAESSDLRKWLSQHQPLIATSDLTTTEILRACRTSAPEAVLEVTQMLTKFVRIPLSRSLCHSAGVSVPLPLKSLDALHVATAMLLSEEILGVLTYDRQMIRAAHALGLPTFSPGAVLEEPDRPRN